VTKRREPLTFESALARVSGLIGWAEAAAIVGQSERTIRNWSDPDTSAGIPIGKAERLDVAFQVAGGDGAPFLQTYQARLRIDAAEAQASRLELARAAADAARESGEAMASLFQATARGASPADLIIAEREVQPPGGAAVHPEWTRPLARPGPDHTDCRHRRPPRPHRGRDGLSAA
jgi:hypothetical protein